MWTCEICAAEIEDDSWDSCWKCTSPRGLTPEQVHEEKRLHRTRLDARNKCLRCETVLQYAGTKRFRTAGAEVAFGFDVSELGEAFVGREAYDVFYCRGCGKVEFYLTGFMTKGSAG